MTIPVAILSTLLLITFPHEASSFSALTPSKLRPLQQSRSSQRIIVRSASNENDVSDAESSLFSEDLDHQQQHHHAQSRRAILRQTILATTAAATFATITTANPLVANAALGSLPEYSDTNAIFQSITIDVTDKQQYDQTIAFFTSGFDGMKVLRERGGSGGGKVKDAWLGFGPETLSIPPNFELPVSSLAQYGGHASIHLRLDPLATSALYRRSSGEFNNEPAPGDSIAFLQLGVPQYRISQMVKDGGNVLDAYGWVNVVSPAGLPVRGIVGIRPDPMMFLAVNCEDVAKSEEFYGKLGFVRQEYPYARLNEGQGQFEPPQPLKSVYIAPSANGMGILLLPNKKRGKRAAVVPNPVVRSVNVVYAPPEGSSDGGDGDGGAVVADSEKPQLADPSSVPISFVAESYLEKEIKMTAVPGSS